jgi:hypothetical protein
LIDTNTMQCAGGALRPGLKNANALSCASGQRNDEGLKHEAFRTNQPQL